jgi:hypothetical protein
MRQSASYGLKRRSRSIFKSRHIESPLLYPAGVRAAVSQPARPVTSQSARGAPGEPVRHRRGTAGARRYPLYAKARGFRGLSALSVRRGAGLKILFIRESTTKGYSDARAPATLRALIDI